MHCRSALSAALVCCVAFSALACGSDSASPLQRQPTEAEPRPVPSEPEAEAAPCDDALTQRELNECSAEDYADADAELTRIYDSLMAEASGDEEERLRAAQRAWLPFRDAHCETKAALYEGGSIQPLIRASCLANVTRERTEHLRGYIEQRNL